MKNYILLLVLTLVFTNVFSINRDRRRQKGKTNRSAICVYENYKNITKRTYFLEIKRLSNSNVSYADFIEDNNILSNDNYKIENGKYYKNFPIFELLEGNDKEINRLKKIHIKDTKK